MEQIKRKQLWDTRLFHDFLMARANTPFQWGANDCALFAADGIESITGVDIAADFRGKYTDEESAYAAVKSICGGSTVADAAAWCAQKFGIAELQHPLMAQRGDLAVVNHAGRLMAGLVHLSGRHIVIPGDQG